MAEFPSITNPNPISKPAEEFPNLYVVRLKQETRDRLGWNQPLTAWLRPYNAATKVLYDRLDKDIELPIGNIWIEAQRSTLFAQVMGGIATYAALKIQETMLTDQLVELSTLDTNLANAQAELAQAVVALATAVDALALNPEDADLQAEKDRRDADKANAEGQVAAAQVAVDAQADAKAAAVAGLATVKQGLGVS